MLETERMRKMFLIVGLGNPGTEYAATRHNIGFDMVTYLSDKYGIALRSKEGKAIVGKGVIEGQKVMLVQPQTYMNLSGESVRALMDYYKLTTDEIVIIYDDISMPVGQVRIRPKGSAGGHNGIKSIIMVDPLIGAIILLADIFNNRKPISMSSRF